MPPAQARSWRRGRSGGARRLTTGSWSEELFELVDHQKNGSVPLALCFAQVVGQRDPAVPHGFRLGVRLEGLGDLTPPRSPGPEGLGERTASSRAGASPGRQGGTTSHRR